MTALALLVLCALLLTATRGLALGADGDVLRLRFGGDAQRTRVVIDLDASTRGTLVEAGGNGQLVVDLDNIRAGRGQSGQGMGLVRAYRVAQAGSRSRIELALASGVEVERRFLLSPGDGVDHYRYVIDLRATGEATAAIVPPPRTAATSIPRGRGGDARPLIVIDPGHGGRDPGALAADSTREKDVVLKTALSLKTALEASGRYTVHLTRDDDTYVEHEDRVTMARNWGADLFISIHADAAANRSVAGATVYTLNSRGQNRVDPVANKYGWHLPVEDGTSNEVASILTDLTKRETKTNSAIFAEILIPELASAGPIVRNSHRQENFFVLLAPDVPAVLIEVGFLTNRADAARLASADGRERSAKAIARAIDAYFDRSVGHTAVN